MTLHFGLNYRFFPSFFGRRFVRMNNIYFSVMAKTEYSLLRLICSRFYGR